MDVSFRVAADVLTHGGKVCLVRMFWDSGWDCRDGAPAGLLQNCHACHRNATARGSVRTSRRKLPHRRRTGR